MNSPQKIAIDPLRKRAQFIAMRAGKRQHSTSFLLQMLGREKTADSGDSAQDTLRIGYTVTKKTGNAVVRNRIKRRMRELVRAVMPLHGQTSHDYVLIGKRAALDTKFETMIAELTSSLKRVHGKKSSSRKHG